MRVDFPLIITIDGPAGTGKSTVARLLANRLGLSFLDTGAMYRAAAAIAIDKGLLDGALAGETADLIDAVVRADLHFDWERDPPEVMAWLESLEPRIRDADVTGAVSRIAAISPLRTHLVQKQRLIAAQRPRLVSEGRDQGSVVFPDAPIKFYLDATPEIRAKRRVDQLRGAGAEADPDKILSAIIERDRSDKGRTDGPLVCPEDAVIVDTTGVPLGQVVDGLESRVNERVAVLLERDA